MANLSKSGKAIIAWLKEAGRKLIQLVEAGQIDEAKELWNDIELVIRKHIEAFDLFIPVNPVGSMPGNWLKKLKWITRNIGWIQIVINLTSGVGPFDVARTEARKIALKWKFDWEY